MAKRKTTRQTGAATKAAVSVGTTLGKIAAQVDTWLAQRDDIAQELHSVIGRAQHMLSSLGNSSAKVRKQAAAALRTVRKSAKKARRTMSAEARAKIGAAQKVRWAKVKKAKAAAAR